MNAVDSNISFRDKRVDWVFETFMDKSSSLNFELENDESYTNTLNLYFVFKFNDECNFSFDKSAFHSLKLNQNNIERIYSKLPTVKNMNLLVEINETLVEDEIVKIISNGKDMTLNLEIENWTLIF